MRPPLTHGGYNAFSRFAQSAAALLLLTIGFAAPAHAQNNKQIISGTWYEDRASNSVSFTNLMLTFDQTPADQFLNITNVSCVVQVNSTQIINQMAIIGGTTSGGGDIGRQYEIKGNVTPETQGSFKYYSIVTNQIFYKFGPGRFPSILIVAGSTGSAFVSANCVIVDPHATLAVHCGDGFGHGFSPYQIARLNR